MEFSTFLIFHYFEIYSNILLFIFQITVVIFICFQWKKPKSLFRSAYFVMLNSIYIYTIFFNLSWIYGHWILYSRESSLIPYITFFEWYAQSLLGFWEAVLGLNRCTALAFPRLHEKLWKGKRVIAFLLILFAFPFIVHGYVFFNFGCKFLHSYEPQCAEFNIQTNRIISIVNIIFGLLALMLILTGILMSPKLQHLSSKAKMERRLIFQTLFSSTMLVLLYIACYYSYSFDALNFLLISYFLYLFQFYPSIIILFFVSPIVREGYAKFYGFNCFVNKNRKPFSTKIIGTQTF